MEQSFIRPVNFELQGICCAGRGAGRGACRQPLRFHRSRRAERRRSQSFPKSSLVAMAYLMYFSALTTGRSMATESSQRFPENGTCRHHLDRAKSKVKVAKRFSKKLTGTTRTRGWRWWINGTHQHKV